MAEADEELLGARAGSAPAKGLGPPRTEPSLPLAGLKVCDLATFWAGPVASCLFSALGADVVKVESIQRPDGMRFASGLQRDELWEWSPVTHGANTGKRSVTLDLSSDDGLALVKRLVEMSDIVIEELLPPGWWRTSVWTGTRSTGSTPTPSWCGCRHSALTGPWRDRNRFRHDHRAGQRPGFPHR